MQSFHDFKQLMWKWAISKGKMDGLWKICAQKNVSLLITS